MMTTVATFLNPHEAHIARAELELEGVPAAVAEEHSQWLSSNALSGVKLQVPASFQEQAIEILSENYSQALVEPGQEGILSCPKCKSASVEAVSRGEGIALLRFITSLFSLRPSKGTIRCKACGEISDFQRY